MDSPQRPTEPQCPRLAVGPSSRGHPGDERSLLVGLSTALCKQAILGVHHRGRHPGSSAPGLLCGSQALTDVAQLGSECTRPVSKPVTSPQPASAFSLKTT